MAAMPYYCNRWFRKISFSLVAVIAAGAIFMSGCTINRNIPLKESFSNPMVTRPSGPVVSLLPVQETFKPELEQIDLYKGDQTFLGKALESYFLLTIVPIIITFSEYHADMPRSEIIRLSAISRLRERGIPAESAADIGKEQRGERLMMSVRLKELSVDSQLSFFLTLIGDTGARYDDIVTRTALECKVWQPGIKEPAWTGTFEASVDKHTFEKESNIIRKVKKEKNVDNDKLLKQRARYKWNEIILESVAQAFDKCITNSPLLEIHAKLRAQQNAEFLDKARAYRDMAIKPALSDDVERNRLLAEEAFKNENYEKAIEYYEAGLDLQPFWPQGQYNAALLSGELQDYANAAEHMSRYLTLVPDAANAKTAREKMLLWQGKAREKKK